MIRSRVNKSHRPSSNTHPNNLLWNKHFLLLSVSKWKDGSNYKETGGIKETGIQPYRRERELRAISDIIM
jgi:hypothetical protein